MAIRSLFSTTFLKDLIPIFYISQKQLFLYLIRIFLQNPQRYKVFKKSFDNPEKNNIFLDINYLLELYIWQIPFYLLYVCN